MGTAHEFYESVKRDLQPSERLRLARLILDDIAESGAAALEYSDHWSDEDLQDVAAFSARCGSEQTDNV